VLHLEEVGRCRNLIAAALDIARNMHGLHAALTTLQHACSSSPNFSVAQPETWLQAQKGRRASLAALNPMMAGRLIDGLAFAADMCLSPEGRGEHECVVSVPNEYLRRITPPSDDEFKQLEQIMERSITPK